MFLIYIFLLKTSHLYVSIKSNILSVLPQEGLGNLAAAHVLCTVSSRYAHRVQRRE